MLQMIKKILHPDNMLFKMVVLNCGLLLLVTIVITTAGNIIYQGSMEEHSYANTWRYRIRYCARLILFFSLFRIMQKYWEIPLVFRNI